MSTSFNELIEEMLLLSPAVRASLAEKIVESIESDMENEIQKSHLDKVKMRRKQVEEGHVSLIPGDQAIKQVRFVLET